MIATKMPLALCTKKGVSKFCIVLLHKSTKFKGVPQKFERFNQLQVMVYNKKYITHLLISRLLQYQCSGGPWWI